MGSCPLANIFARGSSSTSTFCATPFSFGQQPVSLLPPRGRVVYSQTLPQSSLQWAASSSCLWQSTQLARGCTENAPFLISAPSVLSACWWFGVALPFEGFGLTQRHRSPSLPHGASTPASKRVLDQHMLGLPSGLPSASAAS